MGKLWLGKARCLSLVHTAREPQSKIAAWFWSLGPCALPGDSLANGGGAVRRKQGSSHAPQGKGRQHSRGRRSSESQQGTGSHLSPVSFSCVSSCTAAAAPRGLWFGWSKIG